MTKLEFTPATMTTDELYEDLMPRIKQMSESMIRLNDLEGHQQIVSMLFETYSGKQLRNVCYFYLREMFRTRLVVDKACIKFFIDTLDLLWKSH